MANSQINYTTEHKGTLFPSILNIPDGAVYADQINWGDNSYFSGTTFTTTSGLLTAIDDKISDAKNNNGLNQSEIENIIVSYFSTHNVGNSLTLRCYDESEHQFISNSSTVYISSGYYISSMSIDCGYFDIKTSALPNTSVNQSQVEDAIASYFVNNNVIQLSLDPESSGSVFNPRHYIGSGFYSGDSVHINQGYYISDIVYDKNNLIIHTVKSLNSDGSLSFNAHDLWDDYENDGNGYYADYYDDDYENDVEYGE